MPFPLSRLGRVLPLLLALAALPACQSEPEVEVDVEPEEIGSPDLLGLWVVTSVDGVQPTEEIRYQFTAQGEVIRTSESGGVQRGTYQFAGDTRVQLPDSAGTPRFYEVALNGDEATFTPEEGDLPIVMRRQARVDLEDVPVAPVPEPGAANPDAPTGTTMVQPDTTGPIETR